MGGRGGPSPGPPPFSQESTVAAFRSGGKTGYHTFATRPFSTYHAWRRISVFGPPLSTWYSKVGSRIAEVHNGSSLFTGDAGQGESNIRRWIIENDWLEAIVALPLNMFYNTGIATYIWLLSNRKATRRKGKVQLIDATPWSKPLRKNLGKKNCELSDEDIARIAHGATPHREFLRQAGAFAS